MPRGKQVAAPLTFAEAYALCAEIAAERDDGFCIELSAWGGHSEGTVPRVFWRVYSSKENRGYDGATAREAIYRYRDGRGRQDVAREQIATAGGEP